MKKSPQVRDLRATLLSICNSVAMITQLQLEPMPSLMARGKQPPVTHALPKQRTLLDCFLEAQAEREKHKRSQNQGPEDQPAGQARAKTASGDQDLADRIATDRTKAVRDIG